MSPIVLSNDPKLSLLKNDFEICKQNFVENSWLIHSVIIMIFFTIVAQNLSDHSSRLCAYHLQNMAF